MALLMSFFRAATEALWLNTLWLLSALTIVGLPAATAAMTGTAAALQRGEEPAIARDFVRRVRAHLVPATLLGWAWIAILAVLVLNFLVVGSSAFDSPETLVTPIRAVLVALAAAHLSLGVSLCLVIDRSEGLAPLAVLRAAISVLMARPGAIGQTLLALGLGATAVAVLPATIGIVPVLTAHVSALGWRLRIAPLLTRVV